jgi:molecular chaperone DnaK
LPAEVRSQFSAHDGSLIKVTNITTHTLGVVLWDDSKVEEYVFPMIKKMTPVPVQGEEQLRNGQGEHEERHCPDRRR